MVKKMAYEAYRAYLNSIPSTNQEYYKDVQQQFMDVQFENSVNFKTIQKLPRNSSTPVNINVRIVKPFDIGTEDRT